MLEINRWECQCKDGHFIRTDEPAEAAEWIQSGWEVIAYSRVGLFVDGEFVED